MLPRYAFVLRPAWLLLHVLCVAAITTMIKLGRWQLTVSENRHFNIRNFGYAIQWWLFAVFVVVMWVRAIRDHAHRDETRPNDRADAELRAMSQAPVAYRRYVMPQLSSEPVVATDPDHAAYNDYLARLDARDKGKTA